MTKAELDEIRERAEKATRGPWFRSCGEIVTEFEDYIICEMAIADDEVYNPEAEFIAHARDDVPRLLDEVGRLQEALKWYAEIKNWDKEHFDRFVFDIDTSNEDMWHFDEHPWRIASQALNDKEDE